MLLKKAWSASYFTEWIGSSSRSAASSREATFSGLIQASRVPETKIVGVVSGPLADRWGARRLAIAGMLLVGAGLALAGLARSLTEVYLAYSLGVGIGIGLSYVPVVGVVQHWFVRRRGLASGLAVSGIGVGTLLFNARFEVQGIAVRRPPQ